MKKNAVVHFEIYGGEPDALARFYTSLFDWGVDPAPEMQYWFVKTTDTDDRGMPTRPGGLNGGMMKRPEGFDPRGWINYVAVESIEATLARAEQLGAKVTKGKAPVPGMGWFAMLIDPQGNNFGIWQHDPGAK